MRVSVVVPHYEDIANLSVCLDGLLRQRGLDAEVEIVVADNDSPCGLPAVEAAVAGRAKVIHVPIRGAGPARNAGVAASTGEVIAFIDSDCRPDPEWLASGLAALATADLVGGTVRVAVDNPLRPTPVEAFEQVFAFDFRTYIEKKGFSGTGNLFTRRAVFDAVGGFRAVVSEDVDWSHRATAAGYRLAFAPAAIVSHPARRTWSELLRRWRRLTREMYALERERGRGGVWWALRALIVLASPVPHAFKVLAHPDLPDLRTRLDAIGVLIAIRAQRTLDMLGLLAGRA